MKRAKKIIFVIISILLALVLIYNVYNFISIKVLHKDLASVNGYAILEVVSGSMEPTIHKGDIIIINTKEKNYKENDIITFKGNEGEFVTHRIKYIDENSMITKGDNNNTEDDAIKTSSIVGKYVTKINGGGRILSSFKNPFTMVMIFIIGLLACILLSTDKDGKPILEQDEKEFQEFLKSKNESIKEEPKKLAKEKSNKKDNNVKKELKKFSNPKVKTNTPSKNDTKNNKTSSAKKENKQLESKETTKKPAIKNDTKKDASKKTITKETTPKASTTKKVSATKKSTTKPVVKVENKKVATKSSEPKKAASKNETAKKVVTKKTSTAKTNATKSIKKTTATKSSKK